MHLPGPLRQLKPNKLADWKERTPTLFFLPCGKQHSVKKKQQQQYFTLLNLVEILHSVSLSKLSSPITVAAKDWIKQNLRTVNIFHFFTS